VIYLDHHAATPPSEAAELAMQEALRTGAGGAGGVSLAWANPSSVHAAGRAARAQLEKARAQVAAALGAQATDVVLTSGGTEACNLAVLGLNVPHGAHVVTTSIEHPAVARAVARLSSEREVSVTELGVPDGRAPSVAELSAALGPRTALCAVQWINHETGNVLQVAQYARACRAAGVPLFVDATQAAGKLPIDVGVLGADALAIASHKLGGPSGAGALWVRRGVDLDPMLVGGAQERGRRAGSPDVLSAVGFGAACEALPERLGARPRLEALARMAQAELLALDGADNGAGGERVATARNASFPGVRGDELVAALDLEGVCVSSGAACSSGLSEPSPVLRAMYPDEAWRASAAVRFSFGPQTRESDLQFALEALTRVLARARAAKPSR
jgi:cysteine desulfurase